MTPADTLTDYRERTAQTEEYLGRVVFLSQRETHVPHRELVQFLTDEGLGEYAPTSPPADVDVYRRITSNAKISREPVSDGVYVNLLTRQVANDDNEIVRRLVVEEVDANGRRLSYDGVVDVIFDKVTKRVVRKTVQSNGFDVLVPAIADQVADQILVDYQRLRGMVNGDGLRSVTKTVVDACYGVPLRDTGGVYFTPKASSAPIDALERVAAKLAGCQVDSIRLVDEGQGKQRQMVHTAADSDIAAEAGRLLAEINELGDAPVGDRKKTSLLRQYKVLSERAAAHEALLEQNLDQSRIQLAQLDYSITAVVARTGAELAA